MVNPRHRFFPLLAKLQVDLELFLAESSSTFTDSAKPTIGQGDLISSARVLG